MFAPSASRAEWSGFWVHDKKPTGEDGEVHVVASFVVSRVAQERQKVFLIKNAGER